MKRLRLSNKVRMAIAPVIALLVIVGALSTCYGVTMGLYDYVNVPIEYRICPGCKQNLDDFQTKDGDPYLNTVDYKTVSNFYTSCDNCNMWVEYKLHLNSDGTWEFKLQENHE